VLGIFLAVFALLILRTIVHTREER
jgi:hypothetical protein